MSSVLVLMISLFGSCINQPKQSIEETQISEYFVKKDSLRFIAGKYDTLLSFEVCVGDSSNVILALDTGSPDLTLDKKLCLSVFNMDSLRKTCLCTVEHVEHSYDSSKGNIDEECIYYPINLIISGDTLKYERFFVADGFAEEFGIDGLFSIPSKYDKNIVFNFSDGCYDIIENCDTSCYDFSIDIEKEWYFTVLKDFPFSFGDDSFYTDLILDTGTGSKTIVLLGPCALDSFLKDYHPVFDNGNHQSYYLIKETGILKDTISIYKDGMANSFDRPIVGLDFLFHFDICWDVPDNKMWFKRNLNRDSHVYFQKHGALLHNLRLITNINCTAAMITRLGIYDNAYAVGLRPFDVLIKAGGKPFEQKSLQYMTYCRENGLMCSLEVSRNETSETYQFSF